MATIEDAVSTRSFCSFHGKESLCAEAIIFCYFIINFMPCILRSAITSLAFDMFC